MPVGMLNFPPGFALLKTASQCTVKFVEPPYVSDPIGNPHAIAAANPQCAGVSKPDPGSRLKACPVNMILLPEPTASNHHL